MESIESSPREAKIINMFGSKFFNSKKHVLVNKLKVASRDRVELIDYSKIEYLAASSNYTIIYLIDGTHKMSSKCLKDVSQRVDNRFIKIHKSFIVNINKLKVYHKRSNEIELLSGTKLSVSRSRKETVLAIFG